MSRDAEHPVALFLIQVLSLIIRWRCRAIRTPLETAQRTTHSIVRFNCTNVFDAHVACSTEQFAKNRRSRDVVASYVFLSTCRSKNSNSRYISRQRYSVTLLSIELCLKTTLHQAAFGSDLKSTWSRVYPFPCPPPEGKRNSSPCRPFSLRPVKVSVSPPITFFPFPAPTSGQILKSTVTVKERETGPRQSLFVGIVREMMC